MGGMKLNIPINSLKLVKEKKSQTKTGKFKSSVQSTESLRTEIDLRGMTMDEAQPVIEKYLDQAYLYGNLAQRQYPYILVTLQLAYKLLQEFRLSL